MQRSTDMQLSVRTLYSHTSLHLCTRYTHIQRNHLKCIKCILHCIYPCVPLFDCIQCGPILISALPFCPFGECVIRSLYFYVKCMPISPFCTIASGAQSSYTAGRSPEPFSPKQFNRYFHVFNTKIGRFTPLWFFVFTVNIFLAMGKQCSVRMFVNVHRWE